MYGVIKGLNRNNNEGAIKSTLDGELQVRAIVESELEHASARGDAYAWSTGNGAATAGDTKLLVKNTSDKFLVFSRIILNPGNVLARYELGIGEETTTPSGTTIAARNINGTVKLSESSEAYETETAIADANKILALTCGTASMEIFDLDGFILGKNQYLQINVETSLTSGSVEVEAHFETELV
jgi:hypothetical protein